MHTPADHPAHIHLAKASLRAVLVMAIVLVCAGLIGLAAGCATPPPPATQEAVATIAIAKIIERTDDPAVTAARVLEIASKLPIQGYFPSSLIRDQIGFDRLSISDRAAVDAILSAIDNELTKAGAYHERSEILALWKRSAVAAARLFLPHTGGPLT